MSSAQRDFWGYVAIISKSWKYQGKDDDLEDSDDGIDQNEGSGDTEQDADGSEDDQQDVLEDQVPTPKYQYKPLPDTSSYIRLLELQAGEGRDLIVCRLLEVALDATKKEKYDSLSYVWGQPGGKSRFIQVCEMGFEVGFNLYCALKNLRYSDRPRFLWVDAICIDQANTAERNVQVPLMCEIYQNAACTVCFLGPAKKSTSDMYKMLEELAQEKRVEEDENSDHQREIPNTPPPAFFNNLPVAPIKTAMSEKYMGDQTIVPLAANEWWHRAWCVQELMLNSNAVVMMSRHVISWEDFRAGVDHGISLQIWGQVAFGFLVNPITVPYLSMRALMNRYRHSKQMGSPAADLLHLLMYCRHRDSTDPRDKIYAVLGLLRATHPEVLEYEGSNALRIPLGYDHDVAFIYRRMSQEIIQKSGNLDVLGVTPNTDLEGLPSWATDWSIRDRIGLPLMQDSFDCPRLTNATEGTKADARFSDDGVRMIISGYELSLIAALTEVLPNPIMKTAYSSDHLHPSPKIDVPDLDIPDATGTIGRYWIIFKYITSCIGLVVTIVVNLYLEDFRSLMVVFSTLFAWERFVISHPPTNPGGKPDAIYWQTLCASTYKNGDIEETRLLFKTWFDLLQPLRRFMKNHPSIAANHPFLWFLVSQKAMWHSYGEFWPYMSCAYHRQLGSTANGWLCLLPQKTKVGDLIILAKGGRFPLVIRSKEKGYYTFVGEAYVHGIMEGEAWDESRCVEIEIR